MNKISAVIITRNEERNIGRCIESLTGVTDDIVVVDAFSTDTTSEICAVHNVRFISHPFEGYALQKNWAMSQAHYDIVLSLDADEVLSDVLRRSIAEVKLRMDCDGYFVNRLTNYCGTWIRHTDWYPDRKIRLWDRRKGEWSGMLHESVCMEQGSSVGKLRGDLLHYSYDSVRSHVKRMNSYTDSIAEQAYENGKRASVLRMTLNPCWKFLKSYVIRRGFLDGRYGLVISVLSAFATFIKYAKLHELTKTNTTARPGTGS